MTALWCDPSQLCTLPCGCVARQRDFSGDWVPLRACYLHYASAVTAARWRSRRRTGVRCRCCGELVNETACACAFDPIPCPRCGGADGKCAHHCECDNPDADSADPWADGHPEP